MAKRSGSNSNRGKSRRAQPGEDHLAPSENPPGTPRDEHLVEMSNLKKKLEIYEFQIDNLRHELEHFKMKSILEGLNAQASKKFVHPSKNKEQSFDESLFSGLSDQSNVEESPGIAALSQWAKENSNPSAEPAPGIPREIEPYRPFFQEIPPPKPISRLLNNRAEEFVSRVKVLEGLVFQLSQKLSDAASELPVPKFMADIGLRGELIETARRAMEQEMRVIELETRLKTIHGLMNDNRELREANEALRQQIYGITIDIDRQFNEQIEKMKLVMENRLADDTEKFRESSSRMQSVIGNLETKLAEAGADREKLIDEIDELKNENAHFKALVKELKNQFFPGKTPRETHEAENPFAAELGQLRDDVRNNLSIDSLLRLRTFFLKSKRCDEGIKTFLQLQDEFEDRSLLPAVCVLVGELYISSGRRSEAEYYLSNKMIQRDALAQSLLRNISEKELKTASEE